MSLYENVDYQLDLCLLPVYEHPVLTFFIRDVNILD